MNKKILILAGLFILPVFAFAQQSVSISVSPTLFDMSANPGQEWISTIRVINSNPFDITVYTKMVNFEAEGESGQSKLMPLLGTEVDDNTLGGWIRVDDDEIVIPAEKTVQIPFTIKVPNDATPGGHFAAIMIGTKSTNSGQEKALVETSQVVTSLVFLRVSGDINEDGSIRSFRTTKSLLEKPNATFELRFQNHGNVHIQPQGNIKIFNMWGHERGEIPINKYTLFGNVLPASVRAYTFEWTGEWSISDIGRYTAEASLAYGVGERKSVYAETSFWVVPWKIVGTVLLVLFLFILFITWSIKLYVRKMLAVAGMQRGITSDGYMGTHSMRKVSVVAPIEAGILDLRSRLGGTKTWNDRFTTIRDFIMVYRIFFIVCFVIIAFTIILFLYVQSASVSERDYHVTVEESGNDITISSRDTSKEEVSDKAETDAETPIPEGFPKIELVNQSGVIRLGAELKDELEKIGYDIVSLNSDFGTSEQNTVIVYDPKYSEEALRLSRDIEGSLLSAFENSTESQTPITVYIGRDYKSELQ